MKSIRAMVVVGAALGLAACSGGQPEVASLAAAASAPAVGKADSDDAADRECRLALRSVQRVYDQQGQYATRCDDQGCHFLWEGSIDVETGLVSGGSTVAVLYRRASDPTWWEVPARPLEPGLPGFVRLGFELWEHLFGPAGPEEPIELIPFVRGADGGRLFDHNQLSGDLDNYRLAADRGFAVWADGFTCTRRPDTAAVVFSDDWSERVVGQLRAGGRLAVHFDLDRLPYCRATHNGYPAWGTTAFVQFLPGGEVQSGSVREFRSEQGVPTNEAYAVPFELDVPATAREAVLWFRNDSGAGNFCETWDSNYDQNYHFEVLEAPEDDPCYGIETWKDRYGGEPSCLDYQVAADYDATHCEFYLDGLGDGYEGHYGIPFRWLQATLKAGTQDGELLGTGMWVELFDHSDATTTERLVVGQQLDGGTWETGLNYLYTGYMGDGSHLYDVLRFAFFLDVRRPSGEVVRLWQSRAGADYTLADAFDLPTTTEYIPYGHVEWASQDAAVFDSKRACR